MIDGTGSKGVALHRQKQSNALGSILAHEQFLILLWGLDEMGRVGGTCDGSLESWKSSRGVGLQGPQCLRTALPKNVLFHKLEDFVIRQAGFSGVSWEVVGVRRKEVCT